MPVGLAKMPDIPFTVAAGCVHVNDLFSIISQEICPKKERFKSDGITHIRV
jgi:hypothetical protein